MPGRPLRRVRRERPHAPLRGYKLAFPVVSADGTEAGFTGVSLGRSRAYGLTAEAVCVHGSRHRCPGRWCGCGFYCFHTLDDARAAACDPAYRHSVLLDVQASGHYIRYEKGLRYARQTVTAIRLGHCDCGRPAQALLTDSGRGLVGWHRLAPACAACAGPRRALSPERFARLAGVVDIRCAEQATAVTALSADGAAAREDTDVLPLLSAEVSVLHARLDHLQSRIDRLTEGR